MIYYIALNILAIALVVARVRTGMPVMKGAFLALAIPACLFFWFWLYQLLFT